MIEVKNLTVCVDERTVLSNINLLIRMGETVVLFGPNGSGKTSLLKTIMGNPDYKLKSGYILFKGKNISALSIDERAQLGIGMAFQRPPAVRGIKLGDLLRLCLKKRRAHNGDREIQQSAEGLDMTDFMERDINLGFSGGEIKRSELLQLQAQRPEFIMLDEPDSGVDLVSIHLVSAAINRLLQKKMKASRRLCAGLIITHSGYLLDYVSVDRAYVMLGGCLHCFGNPTDLLRDIRAKGYEGCIACLKEQ
jgi:Fe-S cluster assembly ATP-binding protein